MTEREKYLYLIGKFVSPPIDWKKETMAAKRILKLFPRIDFWQLRQEKKFGSLLCFTTAKAKSFLTQQYNDYVLENPEEKVYNMSTTPVGENIQIDNKPKSLLEFIRK